MTAAKAPKARLVIVTPDMARQWLARNRGNRPMIESRVFEYATDMEAGRWQVNGQPIIRDTEGNILDGQHRLMASDLSGVAFETFVVDGVTAAAMSTLDKGAPRKFSDTLALMGEQSATTLGAVVRSTLMFQWNDGRPGNRLLDQRRGATTNELLSWFEEWKEPLRAAAILCRRVTSSPASIPAASFAPVAFAGYVHDVEGIAEFGRIVLSGDAPAGDAAKALREYGIRRAMSKDKSDASHCTILSVRAWNRWIRGEQVDKLISYRAGTDRLHVMNADEQPVFPFADADGPRIMRLGEA
jgi:hypothetical protein